MLGVNGTGINQCYHSKRQRTNASVNVDTRCNTALKVHSQVTSAFAFFFDLCCPVLESVYLKFEYHQLLSWIPILIFDANANFTCEHGLRPSHIK